MRGWRPDLIQGWMYHGNLATSLAGWMAPGCPRVVRNVRQSLYSIAAEKPLTRQVIRINRWLSGWVDAIVYNSRLSREQHEAFGFAPLHGRVIPNGFDTDKLQPDSMTGASMRSAMDIPVDAQVIGHVARFHPMKDHASFLRAGVEIMRQSPKVICLLVGRTVNPDNPALAGIIPSELLGRFRFVGERSDVPALMQAMDILCSSSAWGEGFPNVLGEAMALGIPCVATDVGDSARIVGDTGFIVPPENQDALSDALIDMLSMSEEKRHELGRIARKRISLNYSLAAVIDGYSGLYSEHLNRGRRRHGT